jgi:hypothetical protein
VDGNHSPHSPTFFSSSPEKSDSLLKVFKQARYKEGNYGEAEQQYYLPQQASVDGENLVINSTNVAYIVWATFRIFIYYLDLFLLFLPIHDRTNRISLRGLIRRTRFTLLMAAMKLAQSWLAPMVLFEILNKIKNKQTKGSLLIFQACGQLYGCCPRCIVCGGGSSSTLLSILAPIQPTCIS